MRFNKRLVLAMSIAAIALLSLPRVAHAQHGRARVRVVAPVIVTGGPYYRYYDPFWDFYGPWGYPWGPPYGYYGRYPVESSVRLQVTPKETEVFVDGYYAGIVDDFDGFSQRLRLDPGEHLIELHLPGHRAVTQSLLLQAGESYRVRHAMEPLQPGEAEPPRPTPRANAGPLSAPAPPEAGQRRMPPPDRRRGMFAPGGGTLVIRVQPADAVVLVDGERWETSGGGAPLEIALTPGPHRIEVQRDGYQPFVREVPVRPDAPTPLNVSLTRQQ